MKCDHCKAKYQAHKGYTLKRMRDSRIAIHACSLKCMKLKICDLITEETQQDLTAIFEKGSTGATSEGHRIESQDVTIKITSLAPLGGLSESTC